MNYANKNSKTLTSSLLFVIGLGTVMAIGMNCSGMKSANLAGLNNGFSTGDTHVDPPTYVGFLSSEQMIKTMIASTGTEGLGDLTETSDDLIDKTYKDKTGMLPSLQNLNQASGPTLIAVTNLASAVCAKAVDRDRAVSESQRAQRLFFREFDFSQGLSQQTSDSVTMAFERVARNAWRRNLASEDSEMILSFAQEFSVGVSATDPIQTRLLAVSICTAALSSIDALTY